MSLVDRFWGSQQAQRGTTRTSFGYEAGGVDFSLLFEAACVARFKGWASVELGTGERGDVVVSGYVK